MQQPGRRLFSLVVRFTALLLIGCWVASCNNTNNTVQKPPENVVVKNPENLDVKESELIKNSIQYITDHKGLLNDSVYFTRPDLLTKIYDTNDYQPIWSKKEKWNAIADSLYNFIYFSKLYGLFPSDYYLASLLTIRNGMVSDTLHRRNAALWAKADLMLTGAYLSLAKDLKLGRLAKDSVTLRIDSLINDDYFLNHFLHAVIQRNIRQSLEQLEPTFKGYVALKGAIKSFLDSAVLKKATYIFYPNKESLSLAKHLKTRLGELGYTMTTDDSTALKATLRKYQKQKGLPVTGKLSDKTIASLNSTDWEKYKRIAVTLDRYKLLPDTLPSKYIWVNLPGFYMQLWDGDSLYIQSKIVVGKPQTRTPVLTSKISDMVTYPLWTIPESIIVKEVLPGLKKDTAYLKKKGYSLINFKGEEVAPGSVNWKKYKKGIPYKVVQGSGDDNALGMLKFNFSNKYSVYLHDTNQRYFFKNSMRALSHGCVRVQQWDKLAHYLIQNDSLNAIPPSSFFKADTLRAWLVRKEKHVIPVKSRLPLFIRYFSVEAKDGKVKFYDDIYGEDKLLSERYFANKPVN